MSNKGDGVPNENPNAEDGLVHYENRAFTLDEWAVITAFAAEFDMTIAEAVVNVAYRLRAR